jgi:integrase
MKTATVKLYLDTRRGHDSIKLLVIFDRKSRMYATGFNKVDKITWERLESNADREKPDGKIKDEELLNLWDALWNQPEKHKKEKPLGLVHVARSKANALGPNFTFERFKDLLDNHGKEAEASPADDVLVALEAKAESMKQQGRIQNGLKYHEVAVSLRRFLASHTDDDRRELNLPTSPKRSKAPAPAPTPTLHFKHVTKDFLKLYEEWMVTMGKAPKSPKKPATGASLTTVGIYCRHLRSVFNDAIEAGVVTQSQYPFGKNRYVIPAGKNTKKALTKDEVLRIIAYQCMPGMEQRGRDLWVFSYLCNGMNMVDICTLRWADVDLNKKSVTFIRQKSKRSRKGNQAEIRAILNAETVGILERWGTQPRSPKAYVFPFLSDGMTAEQEQRTVQQVIKMTNQHIDRVAKAVGITAEVRTYAARHSFATILLQSDAPLAFISQALGHTTIKTTESYLGSFDDDKTRKYLDALL